MRVFQIRWENQQTVVNRKFKFEFDKNIPNVYYVCDGVMDTCAGLVLYDHRKGGKHIFCDDF